MDRGREKKNENNKKFSASLTAPANGRIEIAAWKKNKNNKMANPGLHLHVLRDDFMLTLRILRYYHFSLFYFSYLFFSLLCCWLLFLLFLFFLLFLLFLLFFLFNFFCVFFFAQHVLIFLRNLLLSLSDCCYAARRLLFF